MNMLTVMSPWLSVVYEHSVECFTVAPSQQQAHYSEASICADATLARLAPAPKTKDHASLSLLAFLEQILHNYRTLKNRLYDSSAEA